jgi:carbohydrate-selective porin OprB
VLDPNSKAENFADHAFDTVNLYLSASVSYDIAGMPGQFSPLFDWSMDLDDPATIAAKLKSGQPLRGIGIFGRIGYAPQDTNPITRNASIALFARGVFTGREYDSFGIGFYYNQISNNLKTDITQFTAGMASARNESGAEIFYNFAITPAVSLIPSYQHIWHPLAAQIAKHQDHADVFLTRLTVAW